MNIRNLEFKESLDILNHLRYIPRFKTILLFLSKSIKNDLKEIFNELEKEFEKKQVEEKELKQIKLIYKC